MTSAAPMEINGPFLSWEVVQQMASAFVAYIYIYGLWLKHYMIRNWNAKQCVLITREKLEEFGALHFLSSWGNMKAVHSTSNSIGRGRKLDTLCDLSLQPSHLICPMLFNQSALLFDYVVLKRARSCIAENKKDWQIRSMGEDFVA